MVSRRNATFFIDGHLNQDFNGQVSPRFSVLKAAVGLYICLMLIVNLSACSAPERRRVFHLSTTQQVSAQTLEQSKQIIIQRLNWLGLKSFNVDMKEQIDVTLVEQKGFSFDDDVLNQIFLTGLIEWVDVGSTQYNRGDTIDRSHIQLTIFPWEGLAGQFRLTYNTRKELAIEFVPASLEVGRSLNMNKFDGAYPGVHHLCLVRDDVVFFCSSITLPFLENSPLGLEPILGRGRAVISIPAGYDSNQHDFDQIAILTSQLQSGPLPIKFRVTQQ